MLYISRDSCGVIADFLDQIAMLSLLQVSRSIKEQFLRYALLKIYSVTLLTDYNQKWLSQFVRRIADYNGQTIRLSLMRVITHVTLQRDITDEKTRTLYEMRNLESVNVSSCENLTDFKFLQGVSRITMNGKVGSLTTEWKFLENTKELYALDNPNITEECLCNLDDNLKSLNVSYSNVSRLDFLRGIPNIDVLGVAGLNLECIEGLRYIYPKELCLDFSIIEPSQLCHVTAESLSLGWINEEKVVDISSVGFCNTIAVCKNQMSSATIQMMRERDYRWDVDYEEFTIE